MNTRFASFVLHLLAFAHRLLAIAVVLFSVTCMGVGFNELIFANKDPNRKTVFINQELGIAGEVTGYNKARGYKIYVDSSSTPYNLDDFENDQLSPNNGLGYYLEHGDRIAKSPNSTSVVVKRGDRRSEWHFVARPERQSQR